jgi:pullulanase
MNLIGSHDTQRVLSACGGDKQKFLQMVAFQLSYPGAPMIYYGDEAGVTSLDHCESGRKGFPWGREDLDIQDFYRRALAARRTSKALRYGDFYVRHLDDEKRVYVFGRQYKDEVVYAAFNAGSSAVPISIPLALHYDAGSMIEDMLGGYPDVPVKGDSLNVRLQPHSAGWFRVKE